MASEEIIGLLLILIWAVSANAYVYLQGGYSLPSREEVPKTSIRLRDLIGIFTVFLVIQTLVVPSAVLLYRFYETGVWGSEAGFEQGWINIVLILASAAGVIFYCRVVSPTTRGVIALQGEAKWIDDLKLGASFWLVSFPVVSIFATSLTAVLNFFGLSSDHDQVAVHFLKETLANPPLFWTSFWLIILVVPFIEETLFRGFLQNWFGQLIPRFYAILVTSAIFSLFHFSISQGWHNVDLLAALFLLSCYMGFLYEKRGSIWASAALHMTFNAISEIAIVVQEIGQAA